MRVVLQRVRRASVEAGGETIGRIGPGAVVLVGIGVDDDRATVAHMADRVAGLRYFEDADGRTNRDILEAGGSLLVVSQFTLLADLRRGRRPGFAAAARPEVAEPLVDAFVARLRAGGISVETGRFGATMGVDLLNDGPFTLVLDSDPRSVSGVGEPA